MQSVDSRAVPALVRLLAETVFCAAYVVAVYELVVAGGIALWPDATDDWILQLWIVAAAISGLGLKPVRALARSLLRRLWPSAAEPYAALASFVAAVSAADRDESAVRQLAQLAVAGTGARAAGVWCREADGALRLTGYWPRDDSWTGADRVADLAALAASPGVDHLVAVLDAGELLGALALTAGPTRGLTPRDERLAADMANAAGPLLRNAELAARLADQVREQTAQAAELERSRRRVLAARDAAREQLGREIGAHVGDPLLQCSATVSALLDDGADHADGRSSEPGASADKTALADMTELIDAAIGDFRRIVHGVYPAVLADHGLVSALENLLGGLPRRTVFRAPNVPRFAARMESGVYFCVTALLGSLPAEPDRPLQLTAAADAQSLTLVLLDGSAAVDEEAEPPTTQPPTTELPDMLRDRVEALEGTLQVTRGRDWSRYELRVPVASAQSAVPSKTVAV